MARKRPRDSARIGLETVQIWTLTALMASLVAVITTGSTPLWTALLGLGFASVIALRLYACAIPAGPGPVPPLPDALLPRATLLIAAYREASVIGALINALKLIDYPRDRLEIKLLLEADDTDTWLAALAAGLDERFELIRVPPGQPQTKPRALNFGLRHSRGEIVTILDAEDHPDPGQLREAAERFAAGGKRLACLQAPLNWYNHRSCWLTRQFALEYAAHFLVLLPAYIRLGWPIPLGGTSNYFRRDALKAVGAWDAFNVTEDADLGFRLYRAGYRFGLIAKPTLEEAPERAWPWIKQRTRWLKGYAQTLAVHTRLRGDGRRRVPALALGLTLGAALISAFAHLPLAMFAISRLIGQASYDLPDLAALAFLLSGYGAAMACAALGMQRAGHKVRLIDLAGMPLYWPLQTIAALRAVWELIDRPFYWDKTEHGQTDARACISTSRPP
ncbi:glycosyltransferase family 2 protein [Maricaulis sp.]|uniref:glycosyltransferase family 2 protein n=1 Tax=Maricaulis sp. TaxID=1486257 RepID=UPI00261BAE2E|nr:glycosyltransferase family 2 protein [Maricaulis sp.]